MGSGKSASSYNPPGHSGALRLCGNTFPSQLIRSRHLERRFLTLIPVFGVGLVAALRQREDYDYDAQRQYTHDQDAAFRACSSAAKNCRTLRMRGEEAMLVHRSAVSYAKKEGLTPVPGGMNPNRTPERAGAPDAQADKHSDEED